MALFMHSPRFRGINPFYLLWICYLPVLASVITLCHCYYNDGSEKSLLLYNNLQGSVSLLQCRLHWITLHKGRNHDTCRHFVSWNAFVFRSQKSLCMKREKIICQNVVTKISTWLTETFTFMNKQTHEGFSVKRASCSEACILCVLFSQKRGCTAACACVSVRACILRLFPHNINLPGLRGNLCKSSFRQ